MMKRFLLAIALMAGGLAAPALADPSDLQDRLSDRPVGYGDAADRETGLDAYYRATRTAEKPAAAAGQPQIDSRDQTLSSSAVEQRDTGADRGEAGQWETKPSWRAPRSPRS